MNKNDCQFIRIGVRILVLNKNTIRKVLNKAKKNNDYGWRSSILNYLMAIGTINKPVEETF
jgi:hypothetical protein